MDLDRQAQAEGRMRLVLDVAQGAVEDRRHEGAGVLQLEPFTDPVRAAGPTGIEQPHVGLVLLDPPGEPLGVDHRRPGQEGPAEAGAEVRLRLGHARLGARELRGVTVDEVVHRLLAAQPAHRRQHPEGVGRQKDHVAGVGPHRGDAGPRDEPHRIGHPGVLGLRVVVVVRLAGCPIEHHVLEDRPEADGVVDLRLARLGEPDALGVAAALDVEDALVRPAVLVVADQRAVGVGREGGLARPAEAEEEGHVARVLLVDVRRAVHGEDLHLRQVVVHREEDRLLDLAGVFRTDDHDLPLLDRLQDRHRRVEAEVGVVVESQLGGVDDRPLGVEVDEVVAHGVDEERLGEEAVPGQLGDHRHPQPVVGIGAGQAVESEELLLAGEMIDRAGLQPGEVLGADRLVHPAPVDGVVDAGRVFEELVLGAAPGAVTGVAHQGAVGSQDALATTDGRLDQTRCREVAEDLRGAEVQGRGGRRDGHATLSGDYGERRDRHLKGNRRILHVLASREGRGAPSQR